MKRETSNVIRLLMEDVLPPFLRDTRLFAWAMTRGYKLVPDFAAFRRRAHELTSEEYGALYSRIDRVHEDTDNSAAVLDAIAGHVLSGSVLDVGCGTGFTLGLLNKKLGASVALTGVDFQISDATRAAWPQVTFVEQDILKLPFADASFDTVISTHTLEHILDIRAAIAELRRVCAKRLIIVVPREREGLYTFNPHFHFFPYTHSFLRMLIPLPRTYAIRLIGRDIFYYEDCRD